jgi:hypothetical protein
MQMASFACGQPPNGEMAEPTTQLSAGQRGLGLFLGSITSNRLEPLVSIG